VVFVELIGYYRGLSLNFESFTWLRELTEGTLFEKNFLWYAVFWQVGSALFLSFYFHLNLDTKSYKKVIRYSVIIYSILTIIFFIINYEIYYNDQVKSIWFLGVLQIIICSVCYFLEILNSDKIMSFYKSVDFYIAAVFFIWFLIRTPLIFYQIYYSKADWTFVFLRRDIILFANVFMYLTFAFVLIWCKPEHQLKTKQ
jgi:hypothetical protein